MPKDGLSENTKFAEWLNAELFRRRMTQNDLEREMGASGGVVSRWSRGIASPAPKFVERLAELWSIDVDWLLTLTGYRPNVELRDDITSPRANLIQLMDEIELTPERIILVTAMLENMKLVDLKRLMAQETLEEAEEQLRLTVHRQGELSRAY